MAGAYRTLSRLVGYECCDCQRQHACRRKMAGNPIPNSTTWTSPAYVRFVHISSKVSLFIAVLVVFCDHDTFLVSGMCN